MKAEGKGWRTVANIKLIIVLINIQPEGSFNI
jgi:hypothetical protein